MNKKYLLIILCLLFALATITTIAMANEPVNNSDTNASLEVGPGVNCDLCADGPMEKQTRMEERRQLQQNEGTKGQQKQTMNMHRRQRMQLGK